MNVRPMDLLKYHSSKSSMRTWDNDDVYIVELFSDRYFYFIISIRRILKDDRESYINYLAEIHSIPANKIIVKSYGNVRNEIMNSNTTYRSSDITYVYVTGAILQAPNIFKDYRYFFVKYNQIISNVLRFSKEAQIAEQKLLEARDTKVREKKEREARILQKQETEERRIAYENSNEYVNDIIKIIKKRQKARKRKSWFFKIKF